MQGQCISFDEQIDQHYSTVHATLVEQLGPRQASTHLAESLFSVAIGGNDIINRVLLSQLVGTQDQFISSLANSLKRQLQVCMYTQMTNIQSVQLNVYRTNQKF
jgi:hypothetical protein